MEMLWFFLPLIIMLVLFYFLLIRPERKKAQELKNMQDHLVVGDHVMSVGGIIGEILEVKDDSLLLKTGESIIEINKHIIVKKD